MDEFVRVDRAVLSEAGEWATTGGRGADAANLLFAAVVQSGRPGGGRCAQRLASDARVCGYRSGAGAGAGRNYGMQVPPSAGGARTGRRDAGNSEPAPAAQGIRITKGTIVDATIINAPSSTKNEAGQRDPEMRQTKKGGQWYFGMKAHVGVDSRTKMIRSVVATGANQADAKVLPHLLHGEEREVWGEQGYVGQSKVIAEVAPQARESINRLGFRCGRRIFVRASLVAPIAHDRTEPDLEQTLQASCSTSVRPR
jgi:hypothetical protein